MDGVYGMPFHLVEWTGNMPRVKGTQVVARVCQLLRSFDGNNTHLSLAEIAREVNLPPATAYRILQALVYEGLLRQDPETTNYSLGFGLVGLGELAKQSNDLPEIARPHAEKLAQFFGETVTIEVLNPHNGQVDTALFVPSSYRLSQLPSYNRSVPAHCTATGKVQLAHLPSEQLDEYLAQELQALTPKSIVAPEQLSDEDMPQT
jgi:DNA-binding IclR family transcriptional regulator